MADGSLVARDKGTPQGGVISPLLANLFLHYVFDVWLETGFPGVPFERYADDIICHCRSERQAVVLRAVLERRFTACGLMLHPEKTKIVYCKDNRAGEFHIQQFDFLGYTFRPRLAQWRGKQYGVSFLPAASPSALKAIRHAVRAGPSRPAATRRSTIWLGCSIRTSVVGSTTTATFTNLRCTRHSVGSTRISFDGQDASSNA